MSQDSMVELLDDTLDLLEWRLRRLEFVLDGSVNRSDQPASSTSPPILARVQKLEQAFQQLSTKSEVARELIKWRGFGIDILNSSIH